MVGLGTTRVCPDGRVVHSQRQVIGRDIFYDGDEQVVAQRTLGLLKLPKASTPGPVRWPGIVAKDNSVFVKVVFHKFHKNNYSVVS